MMEKQISIIMVLALMALALCSLLPGTVNAQSAMRTLPASLTPDVDFTVNVTASDYGSFGQIVETVPSGFTYVGSSLPSYQVDISGSPTIKFTLFGETSFTYMVRSAETPGTYAFNGILKDEFRDEYPVTGDTTVVIRDAPPELTADADGPYTGIINTSVHFLAHASGGTPPYLYEWDFEHTGAFTVDGTGKTISTTYTHTGNYTLAVRVTDSELHEAIDLTTVEIRKTPSAHRILPVSRYPGENCMVTLNISSYGTSVELLEQLPDGFFYINSSIPGSYLLENNTIRFILANESTVTYTLQILNSPGTYSFNGVLKGESGEEAVIRGDGTLIVEDYPLTVDVITYHYKGKVNQAINISPSVRGGYPPYTIQWDLNNDDIYEITGETITYSWNATGEYTIGLRVVDGANTTATATMMVTISEKQEANIMLWSYILIALVCVGVLVLTFLIFKKRHR